MRKNYEASLPQGYVEACHINAKEAKLGTILNVVSLLVTAATALLAGGCIMIARANGYVPPADQVLILPVILIFCLSLVLYIILHECVHGIAYKILTKQKLTFGLSWSCAFCGVPDVYVYRRASLIALLAPFIFFSLVFIPLTIFLFFYHPVRCMFSAVLLGTHLGGCSGDIYMTLLLLFRYRSSDTLIRDTGPEQFLYTKHS